MTRLYDELKRRNVFRVAVAYLVATWLILQVADLVLENIDAPAWVMQVLLLVFTLGFPLALIFSWAYELTPEGLKLEKDVEREQSVTHETGRKLDQITIGLLVVVVLFVGLERTFFAAPPKGAAVNSTTATAPQKSIAVLAFEDLSAEGDQAYFADGLSEELLNVLAQVPDLQVAGRTSSFAFKGQQKDLREIGDILNVANILEGSVRKSGNRIRVTAQLVNASNGFHLFSRTYDRDLTDIFEVQDDIAANISAALKSELIGTPAVHETAATEFAVYELYLEARQKIHTRVLEDMSEASDLLNAALEIDPDYAPALAQKALVTYLLSDNIGAYGDIPVADALAIARPLLNRALELDDKLAEAYAISGLVMGPEGAEAQQAIKSLERALTLNPNLDDARNWLSTAYRRVGRTEESTALLEAVVERDPLYPPAFGNLIQGYLRRGEFDLATALIGRVERITGETAQTNDAWGLLSLVRGETAMAVRHFRRAFEAQPSDTILRIQYATSLSTLGEFETVHEIGIPSMRVNALRQLGRHDEARAVIDALPVRLEDSLNLDAVIAYFYAIREYVEAIAYLENNYGDLDRVLGLFTMTQGNDDGTGYLGPLAHAYLQLGREQEFRRITDAMAAAIAAKRNMDQYVFENIYARAEYAALTGNHGDVLEHMQTLIDMNQVTVSAFDVPLFDALANNERFNALKRVFRERADRERAKLGLDPYRPIAATKSACRG